MGSNDSFRLVREQDAFVAVLVIWVIAAVFL